jgi:hypothetical protein
MKPMWWLTGRRNRKGVSGNIEIPTLNSSRGHRSHFAFSLSHSPTRHSGLLHCILPPFHDKLGVISSPFGCTKSGHGQL